MKEELEELKNISLNNSKIDFKYKMEDYIEYLEKCINSYNFIDDFSDCLVIIPLLSHIVTVTEMTPKQKLEVYERMKSIRQKIQKLIAEKPDNIDKNNPAFLILRKMIDQQESFMIANFYGMMNRYQGSEIELMEYLLFDVKKYNLVEDVLKQYPYMIRLLDEEGKKLIGKLIEHYVEEAFHYTENKELKPNSYLVYYDKLLDLFLKHPKLEFDSFEKENAIQFLNESRNRMISENYNDLTKRKLIFWLNHLEEKLSSRKHDTTFKEICYMHDVKINFDEGVLSEARRINCEVRIKDYPDRKLIKDDYIITIDGSNAKEIDDGLSIKKLEDGYYCLGVHIADPTSYLPKNSIILDEALKRTTSIYRGAVPIATMFPSILSTDKMSLLENKPRLATSYYLYVNGNGKIENYEFLETIIYVHNTTYNKIDDILKTGRCEDKRLLKTSILLREVTAKLERNFKIDKIYSMVNRKESNPSNTNNILNTTASKIVETAMMMTNYIVPFHMQKHNLPCINRIHVMDAEFVKKLNDLSSGLDFRGKGQTTKIVEYLTSFYPKAKYSIERLGHFGLGIPISSHITAPLRRGIDNIMKLYVLNPFYFNQVSDMEAYNIENKLSKICDYYNERAVIIQSFTDCIKENSKLLTKR